MLIAPRIFWRRHFASHSPCPLPGPHPSHARYKRTSNTAAFPQVEQMEDRKSNSCASEYLGWEKEICIERRLRELTKMGLKAL